jgi:hypothetical protein
VDLTLIPKNIWGNELVLVLVVPPIRITQSTASVMSRTPIGNEIRNNSRFGFKPSQRTRECIIAEEWTNDLLYPRRSPKDFRTSRTERRNQSGPDGSSVCTPHSSTREEDDDKGRRVASGTARALDLGSWPCPGGVRGEEW